MGDRLAGRTAHRKKYQRSPRVAGWFACVQTPKKSASPHMVRDGYVRDHRVVRRLLALAEPGEVRRLAVEESRDSLHQHRVG